MNLNHKESKIKTYKVGEQMPINDIRYKTIEKKTGIAFISSGLAWFIYAMFFPMYRITDFAIITVISIIVFIVVDIFAPKKIIRIELKNEPIITGIPTADEMLKIGYEFIDEIELINQAIINTTIKDKVDKIIDLFTKVLQQIKNDPNDAKNIKQFMNYYLPTISKLLNYYATFEKQQIEGANITASKDKISDLLDTAITAFKKALDSMFADEALDIATDITGMENMLATRGLTDDILDINIKEKI